MSDYRIPQNTSKTGATITQVSPKLNSHIQCCPTDECNPCDEDCAPPVCFPDNQCTPDTEDHDVEPDLDLEHLTPEEEQDCEPNF